jgi:hypothetical protein
MNYLKVYCNLIRKAENRGYTKKKAKEQGLYVEGHHTFPISIFDKNKRIVYLTAREHYIAHCLLEKIYLKRYGMGDWRTHKMIWAHIIMSGKNEFHQEKYLNSYLYEASRLRISQIPIKEEKRLQSSIKGKKSKWWNNGTETKFCEECPGPEWERGRPGTNIGRKHSQETKDKIKIKAIGRKFKRNKKDTEKRKQRVWWNNGEKNRHCKDCPGEGWIIGRGVFWNNGDNETIAVICPGPEWKKGRIPGLARGKGIGIFYWNNGIKQIKSNTCPGPEWKKGRLPEGTYWWNNGEKNIKSKTCPGDKWVSGLLKNTNKNLKWWNNGHSNKMCVRCPGEGWTRGMIKKTDT